MKIPVDWDTLTSVFLDMDGTILDLYFDNYFWHEHVPLRYSQKFEINFDDAKILLKSRYKSKAGTLDWYCIEFWTKELDLDIAYLKQEISNKVSIFPGAKNFLEFLKNKGKSVTLVTNAHRKSVEIKFNALNLNRYFDKIVSSHDYGYAKEQQEFWQSLMKNRPFDPKRTLFIDDNLDVLSVAEGYGIKNLITIKTPDSTKPAQDTRHFNAISCFKEIMTV